MPLLCGPCRATPTAIPLLLSRSYGGTLTGALRTLYNDGGRGLGGIVRFYRGLGPALLQVRCIASPAGLNGAWKDISSIQSRQQLAELGCPI